VSGPALVAGVDSSTQSTKVELRELDSGRLVATGRGAHPETSPPVSEQDPATWWAALTDALAQVRSDLDRIVGVSVAGQQHGLVVTDAAGTPLRPAKLWNDTTSAPQAAALRDRIGADTWAGRCGLVPVASFTITKLAWLAEHEPEHMARVEHIMLPHDWLTWRLTGRHVTDRGDASGTGWWSPVDGDYRDELLGLVVDDPAAWRQKLPHVLGPAEAAGTVRADVARELGLSPDVVVGPGTGDNMAAALGLALKPREVTLSLGTSGTAYAVATAPTTDVTGAVAGFADAAGGYLPLVATLNATKVTQTVARWLDVDVATLSEMALAAPSAPGPTLVPYFDGERTPNLPDATGTWHGLRNDTSREDLARAAFTGVVNGLLAGVDALRAAGVEMDSSLRLIGGGARSPAYRQITADLWGSAITVHAEAEPVATGACVQAAAVVSGRAPLEVAASWELDAGAGVEPDPEADGAALRAAYRATAAAQAANAVAAQKGAPDADCRPRRDP
jgi:xylulokinase